MARRSAVSGRRWGFPRGRLSCMINGCRSHPSRAASRLRSLSASLTVVAMKIGPQFLIAAAIVASAALPPGSPARGAEPPVPERIEFNRDVRAILSDNCFFCHGPDPKNRKADLRLDLRDEAIDSGAIVPKEPSESELVERIESSDPEETDAAGRFAQTAHRPTKRNPPPLDRAGSRVSAALGL